MKYRNIKTGQVIDVLSSISGKNWEKVSGKAPAKESAVDTPAVEEEIKPAKKSRKTMR